MRQQLPVYSPLGAAAVRNAWRTLLLGERQGSALSLGAGLRHRYDARSVVLTDSGTSALAVALSAAVASQPGGLVALPAYSCYNVATSAVGAGVSVRLYDLDPRTLGPDFSSLEKALEDGVTAVVVAPLYGVPVDLERARLACEKHGVMLIEDAAQGAGAQFRGRELGSWGSLSILSFGRGKGTTGGGGGALLSHDLAGETLLEGAARPIPPKRGWRTVIGMTAQWMLARPAWYRLPASLPFLKLGETVYQDPWEPAGMTPPSVAALAVTMPLKEAEVRVRRNNAEQLSRSVSGNHSIEPIVPPSGSEPGYLRLPFLATEPSRPGVLSPPARDLGIMPAYPKALTQLGIFRERCVNGNAEFPGAERLARDLFTLPTHSLVTDQDLAAIDELLRKTSR